MEVVAKPMDFHFNSPANSSAPSTPKRMGDHYFSAPTSPTRLFEFDQLLRLISADHHQNPSPATVPFAWEEKPGVPNSLYKFLEHDFAFDVSGDQLGMDSVIPAEDLFDGGVIRVLPENTKERKNTSMEEKRKRTSSFSSSAGLPSSRSRRTQSFSHKRGWECPWEEEEEESQAAMNAKPQLVSSCSSLSASKGSRKWSFKDLFLFRSASDGRAMDRDPLKKYSAIIRKHDEDFRNSSLRSVGSGSGSKRRGGVSAHELHYKVNRAVANDLKKKTFLPYKQGILGRLAFNPTVHALSNGFGFSHRN
ncbi:uncharacterized protein LOC112514889 [Cynara cardunculus var. scolymus]|uniref:Uncharacterized protein n=1 Tax=Cynara cardunculus var. scolymus TaxID=59895 RepID=A0A103XZ30_CYNCS|nr:uncharacterized protein LOC112514889 [Cynara cardunculus var. scolymus]KVH99466.1 Protein of unknown function DUF1645 [Cynara cardunculus var. scolymus]